MKFSHLPFNFFENIILSVVSNNTKSNSKRNIQIIEVGLLLNSSSENDKQSWKRCFHKLKRQKKIQGDLSNPLLDEISQCELFYSIFLGGYKEMYDFLLN